MTSSTVSTCTPEATKPQAAASNFMLSVLAACSSTVPRKGMEGEATIVDQLANLLQDKAMSLDELNLFYSYRFGFSINDALKRNGFEGKPHEFLELQKSFSVRDGHIFLNSEISKSPETTAVAETTERYPEAVKDENVSMADTESTTDAESDRNDSDSDVDVDGWHSVGNRLVAALNSPGCSEAEDGANSWQSLSARVAKAFDDNRDDLATVDASAWQDVGSRLVAAWKRIDDDEHDEDIDAVRSVGTRDV